MITEVLVLECHWLMPYALDTIEVINQLQLITMKLIVIKNEMSLVKYKRYILS